MSARACRDVRADLSASLDGDLDPKAAGEIRRHLESCAACRSELELLRLTVGALRRLPELPAPAAILDGVRARLRPQPWHRRLLEGRQWLLGVPVGALATLVVVVGIAFFQARYPGIQRMVGPGGPAPPPPARVEAPSPPPPDAGQQPREIPAAKQTAPRERSGDLAAKAAPRKSMTAAAPTPAAAPADSRALEAPFAPGPPEPDLAVQREIAPEESRQQEDQAAAPSRFVIPEPEPSPERTVAVDEYPGGRPETIYGPPHRRFVTRDSLEGQPRTIASLRSAAGIRTAGAPPAAVRPAPPGMVDLAAPGPAPVVPAPAARSAETRRAPAPPAPLRIVLLLPPDGYSIDDVKRLLRREGADEVAVGVLDTRSVREAFAPHRDRLGFVHEPARGWTLRTSIPQPAVAGLLDALARRPGLSVLEQTAAPVIQGRLHGRQDLRFTILR
jgi:anti-sigma factor RsiW